MGIVWALLLDVVVLAAVLFACFRLRASRMKSLRLIGTAVVFCCLLFAGFQVMRSSGDYLEKWFTDNTRLYLKLAVGCAVGFFFLLTPRRAIRAVEVALLIMSPLFAIAGVNAIQAYRAVNRDGLGRGSAAGMLAANDHRNRVIWMVFDEMDQRFVFESRPSRIHLNEFDSLRSQSLYATQASSPNPDTMPSLPSLIVGRTIDLVETSGHDLRFRLQGCTKWEDLRSYPNVFTKARSEGFDTGLSGWHHSYCRLLGNTLSECGWEVGNLPFLVAAKALNSRTFIQKAGYIAEWQAQSFPLRRKFGIVTEPGGAAAIRQHSIETYDYVMTKAAQLLRNEKLNLVLIHLPIPHPPGIWDSARGSLSIEDSDYVDNLQLADITLGRLRTILEQSGDWDRSTVIVSSDHPYRVGWWQSIFFIRTEEMRRLTAAGQSKHIPFLVKLPYQHSTLSYTRPFNTVLTSDLLLEILEGHITSPPDAAAWLDAHAGGSLKGDPAIGS